MVLFLVVIKKPTCNGITLAGDSSVVNINGEEFKAMDAADFQQCLDPIVKGQYTQDQTDAMHAIITRLQSELVRLTSWIKCKNCTIIWSISNNHLNYQVPNLLHMKS